jgi:hypothetical protein
VLKEEAIIGFAMAPEEDGGLNANERAVVDSIFTVGRRGENSKASTFRRGEQRDAVRAAPKISGLRDEAIRALHGRVDEGVCKVVEVAHVDEGHVDGDGVRPHRSSKVFFIRGFRIRSRDREIVGRIRDGDEAPSSTYYVCFEIDCFFL